MIFLFPLHITVKWFLVFLRNQNEIPNDYLNNLTLSPWTDCIISKGATSVPYQSSNFCSFSCEIINDGIMEWSLQVENAVGLCCEEIKWVYPWLGTQFPMEESREHCNAATASFRTEDIEVVSYCTVYFQFFVWHLILYFKEQRVIHTFWSLPWLPYCWLFEGNFSRDFTIQGILYSRKFPIPHLRTFFLPFYITWSLLLQEAGMTWHFFGTSFFFILVKIIAIYFSDLNSFLLHMANGALMQVFWHWLSVSQPGGDQGINVIMDDASSTSSAAS